MVKLCIKMAGWGGDTVKMTPTPSLKFSLVTILKGKNLDLYLVAKRRQGEAYTRQPREFTNTQEPRVTVPQII